MSDGRSTMTSLHPPAEHADKQWHWARHEGDDLWFVFEARNGRMWNGPGHMSADYAYAVGWRYAGPAEPPGPAPTKKPVRKSKAEQIGEMSDAEWERHVRRVGTQGNQPRPA